MAITGINKPIIYINFNADPFKVGQEKIHIPRPLRYQRIAVVLEKYRSVPLEH